MGGARALLNMSIHASVRQCFQTRLFSSHMEIPRLTSCVSMAYDKFTPTRETATCWPLRYMGEMKDRITSSSLIDIRSGKIGPSSIYSSTLMGGNKLLKNMLGSQVLLTSSYSSLTFHLRLYSSRANGTKDTPEISTAGDGISESSNGESTSLLGKDMLDAFEHARQSVVDGATSIADKTKHLSDKVTPHLQQLYDSHPYLEKVIVPVGGTFSATILAWFFMPKIFRKLHKYTSLGPLAVFQSNSNTEVSSYEKSMWGALEDPARYLVTFLAFSQLGMVIAPTTGLYFPHVWRGAVVLSFIWFLHRWKTNFFSISLANQVNVGLDREKLMALEKLSSVGLLVLGVMGLAEVVGVPVQSIITVGGVGGVATAFAARDILGNLLSGLSLQFSKPFVVGDTIKAGSVEGQVTDMGLTATSLINPEKFPVIVPNSLFSSQVIVNKSRAQWRASMNKIPIQVNDIEKVPLISKEIKSMLQAHSKVFLGKDAPFCYLSRVERTFAELTFGCNLKSMRKDELLDSEQDILLQAVRIIQQHGAELGSYQTT